MLKKFKPKPKWGRKSIMKDVHESMREIREENRLKKTKERVSKLKFRYD